MVGGEHTIDWQILLIGELNPIITPAVVGNTYIKAGRTTGLTEAKCTAIGASVRVGYGDFDAFFVDQDVFENSDQPFSAAGDSGSCIICTCNGGPSSLLFAGGGNQTIGNPMAAVAKCRPFRFTQ